VLTRPTRENVLCCKYAVTGPLLSETVVDVVERLMAEFEDRLDLHDIATVVLGCRDDLDCSPPGALPELIERLAHQRLLTAPPPSP